MLAAKGHEGRPGCSILPAMQEQQAENRGNHSQQDKSGNNPE
jgi:hypothetical protein